MASINFRAPDALLFEIRGAVKAVGQKDAGFSRDRLLREGAELRLEQLRATHNNGEPFEPITKPLRAGRRPKHKEEITEAEPGRSTGVR